MKCFGILSLLVLTSCSSVPAQMLKLVSVEQRLELPPIEYPPDIELHVIEYDIPRDTSRPQAVRNTTECLNVAPAKQDKLFWKICGIFPPVPNSNVFLGLDQTNWERMLENWSRVKAHEEMWRARIDEVNRQRTKLDKSQ